MLRALSTRRSHGRYERLDEEEPTITLLDGEFKRTKSLPARVFGSQRRSTHEATFLDNVKIKPAKKTNNTGKIHPLLSLFDFRRKKKTTARPEFSRYIEYLKEGGMWDLKSNKPVLYFK